MTNYLDLLNVVNEVLTEKEANAYIYAHYTMADNYAIAKKLDVDVNEFYLILDSANMKMKKALTNLTVKEQTKANFVSAN